MHPDILPKLAELLVSASERTQLIITTHSDILVDALSARPEAVIVCEKHEGQTTLRRLEPAQLAVWLESIPSANCGRVVSWEERAGEC